MNLRIAACALAAFSIGTLAAEEAAAYLSKFRANRSPFGRLQAEGELKNNTGRSIRGLSVRVAFYDSEGAVVGNGLDFITEIGAWETWKWKATSSEKSAQEVRLKSIEADGRELNWIDDPAEEIEARQNEKRAKQQAEQEERWKAAAKKEKEEAAQKAEKKRTAKLASAEQAKFRGILLRAESGSAAAMRELSDCFRRGLGTQVDEAQADLWHKRAEAMDTKETGK